MSTDRKILFHLNKNGENKDLNKSAFNIKVRLIDLFQTQIVLIC